MDDLYAKDMQIAVFSAKSSQRKEGWETHIPHPSAWAKLARDAGAGEAGHGLGGLVQGADDAGAALAGAGELDGRADLGLHGALAELALVGQALGLVGGELLELLLRRACRS